MAFLTYNLVLLVGFLTGFPVFAESLIFKAIFSNGSVTFTQVGNNVEISSENMDVNTIVEITIREFPVKYDGPVAEICKRSKLGDIFKVECTSNKTKCEVGNLSKILSNLSSNNKVNDSSLMLSGKDSVFGRSLLIKHKNNDVQCATIEEVPKVRSAVGVFRAVSPGIAGTVVFRQPASSPESATTIDLSLTLVDARSASKRSLMLFVHENVTKEKGSCEEIGKIFNPLGLTACDKRNHKTCPIGDIFAKVGPVKAILPGEGSPRSFFVDTNLPLSGKNSIVGRSLVISENGRPLICVEIQEYQEMVGEVSLKGNKGSSRMVKFSQGSVYEPVMVNMTEGLAVDFHQNLDMNCQVGNGDADWSNLTASGKVPGLTLYGPYSALFRPVLVNQLCSTVKPKDALYDLKAVANFTATSVQQPVMGTIQFQQVVFSTSKAFASICSIVMNVRNTYNNVTSNHNWHVHELPLSGEDLKDMLVNVKGHYNPYHVYVEGNDYEGTCNSSSLFRCELGDLSNKLGTYTVGSGVKYFTETENYLASWHNILGRSIVIHEQNKGAGRIACASIIPEQDSFYSQEMLNVKNNTKTRDKLAFQKTLSEVLSVSIWRVADVKLGGSNDCLKYTFSLIDDSKSNLHQVFTDIVNDQPEKLKDFAPGCEDESSGWKINDKNVDEILGVVFGLLALIILVIAIVFWMRKKSKDEELKSKLVTVDGNTAQPDHDTQRESNDIPLKTSEVKIEEQDNSTDKNSEGTAKSYNITTPL